MEFKANETIQALRAFFHGLVNITIYVKLRESVVKLTKLQQYDRLDNEEKRNVIIDKVKFTNNGKIVRKINKFK